MGRSFFIQTNEKSGLERRREYLDWTEQVVTGLRGCNQSLEFYYYQVLEDGRGVLNAERA
jgi:hypothetical protein